jgi:hypothetical protein
MYTVIAVAVHEGEKNLRLTSWQFGVNVNGVAYTAERFFFQRHLKIGPFKTWK